MGSYNCTCYPEYTRNGTSCTGDSCIILFLRYLSVVTKFSISFVSSSFSLSNVKVLSIFYLMSFLRLDMRWASPVAGWFAFLTRLIRGSALALSLCGLARLPRTRCKVFRQTLTTLNKERGETKGNSTFLPVSFSLTAWLLANKFVLQSESVSCSAVLFFLRCWRLYRNDR